jgi:hypothetical protein
VYTCPGYQRPYQQYGAAGFHGSYRGGRRYDQRGSGFGGNFRQTEHWGAYGDQRQMTSMARDVGMNAHGHGDFQGGAAQRDQGVDVHRQNSTQGAQGPINPPGSLSGGGGGHSCAKVIDDLHSIPANMISLFQQFIASMGHKLAAGKSQAIEGIEEKADQAKVSEKSKTQAKASVKEIAES